MKLVFSTLSAALLGTVALASSPDRTAGPIQVRQDFLPADVTQVVHLDVASFRSSTFGAIFIQQRGNFELEQLDELTETLGFDPITELLSVTAYAVGGDSEPNTILITASDAIDSALARASEEEGFQRVSAGGLDLFQLDETFAWVAKLRGDDRVLVVSEDVDNVVRGARVVRGDEKSLAQAGDGSLRLKPMTGAFLSVAATQLGDSIGDFQPASQVFGLAQGVQFDFGEAGGSVFAHLVMSTESIEAARNAVDIVQGLLAIARLAGGNSVPDGALELLRGLQVNSRGNTVSIDFEYSVDAIVALLMSMQDEEEGEY